MSRNKISAHNAVFERLKRFICEHTSEFSSVTTNRCIATDDDDIDWLLYSSFPRKYKIIPGLSAAIAEYQDVKYLVVIGCQSTEVMTEYCTKHDCNSSFITAILSELDIPVRRDANIYSIRNEIFFEIAADATHGETDAGHILSFFEPFVVYQILPEYPLEPVATIEKLLCYYLAVNYEEITLPYSRDAIESFSAIATHESILFPYHLILNSLSSSNWRYSFLSIYQCIEAIFPMIALSTLIESIGKEQLTHSTLAELLETHLGWRPQEIDSMRIIFKEIPEVVSSLLKDLMFEQTGSRDGDLGDWIYKIRNSIVHTRPSLDYIEYSDEYWNKLVLGLLLVLSHAYSKYK